MRHRRLCFAFPNLQKPPLTLKWGSVDVVLNIVQNMVSQQVLLFRYLTLFLFLESPEAEKVKKRARVQLVSYDSSPEQGSQQADSDIEILDYQLEPKRKRLFSISESLPQSSPSSMETLPITSNNEDCGQSSASQLADISGPPFASDISKPLPVPQCAAGVPSPGAIKSLLLRSQTFADDGGCGDGRQSWLDSRVPTKAIPSESQPRAKPRKNQEALQEFKRRVLDKQALQKQLLEQPLAPSAAGPSSLRQKIGRLSVKVKLGFAYLRLYEDTPDIRQPTALRRLGRLSPPPTAIPAQNPYSNKGKQAKSERK